MFERLILAFIGIVFALVIFVIVDTVGGTDRPPQGGTITGRYYVPPQTHYDRDSNGNITTRTDPEKWMVFVSVEREGILTIQTSATNWAKALDGAPATVVGRVGWLSGSVYWRVGSVGGQGGTTAGGGASSNFETIQSF